MGNIFGGGKPEPGATLKEHGVDITELAKKGHLDPVIGRDEEIRRTIQILSRRTKVSSAPRWISRSSRRRLRLITSTPAHPEQSHLDRKRWRGENGHHGGSRSTSRLGRSSRVAQGSPS